jgi:hypothetical protein
MSEAVVSNEGPDNQNVTSGDNQDASSGMVKYESYSKVLGQKKAADQRLKELESELSEFRAKQKAEEESKMLAEKRHEEFIQRLKQENDQLKNSIAATKGEIANSIKRQAVERELGGFARPEYAQFIDLAAIELNEDGSPDPSSLAHETARLREDHAHLLKQSIKLPASGTPPAFEQGSKGPADISWSDALAEHRQQKTKGK